ncbi:hypothetical protein AYI68_g1866 [Smittium mucronatum]|uniref:Uncharacterized protein n=1 Tax=Smittium mucronatum TaxID=133383 RepID=A0A1R0H4H1_9FUNG|nr:hypothetical protein AYI68_g1866 [Smittium mucronatum]
MVDLDSVYPKNSVTSLDPVDILLTIDSASKQIDSAHIVRNFFRKEYETRQLISKLLPRGISAAQNPNLQRIFPAPLAVRSIGGQLIPPISTSVASSSTSSDHLTSTIHPSPTSTTSYTSTEPIISYTATLNDFIVPTTTHQVQALKEKINPNYDKDYNPYGIDMAGPRTSLYVYSTIFAIGTIVYLFGTITRYKYRREYLNLNL